ncbi:hypothetical protein GCM10010274_11230 [Streptomyces lavendofoliae]|uniref:Uncharacterized protein n=1 Tax=Streptomyces lavendofoliae TaxID=67314 RepID=A0A918HVF8_9ACTN|nr:hypothetical protein GCM10010274_11230 [Streptomyces lavendofoliae]
MVHGSVVLLCVDLLWRHGLLRVDALRNLEQMPVLQTGMIGPLAVDRQYSASKMFPPIGRNFRPFDDVRIVVAGDRREPPRVAGEPPGSRRGAPSSVIPEMLAR